MAFDTRLHVRQYIHHHVYYAQIQFSPADGECARLIERLVDCFMAANPRLLPTIDSEVNGAPMSRQRNRKNTWKDRLRKASAAYCRALYVEFDTADLYMKPNGEMPVITCVEAMMNANCFALACVHAKVLCKDSKNINGFVFFEAA